jgi:hypothetical protein
MLDKRSFRILDIIIGMALDGESVVIYKNEIIAKFGEEIEILDLDAIVEALALNDMFTIRYSDETLYCVTPRPKGRIAYEKRLQQTAVAQQQSAVATVEMVDDNGLDITNPTVINMKKLAIICGSCSFIGSLLAVIAALIIARFF